MNTDLRNLLRFLADTLNPQRQVEIGDLYARALAWEPVERLPLVLQYPLPDDARFRPYPHREIFDDPEKMLFNELVYAFSTSIAMRDRLGDDLPCSLRADFGTVLIASLFGVRIEQVDDNPPWARHFQTLEEFEACLDHDPLDFSCGWGHRVIERYVFYRQVLEDFPPLMKTIRIILPDLEGPMSTAELLRGSAIYTDFYNNADLVDKAFDRLARAQVGFARNLDKFINDGHNGLYCQHCTLFPGKIMVRVDSVINLSPEMYAGQVAPYDEFVLNELGNGGVHSCGCVNHLIKELLSLPSLRAFDLGQPEMNDIDSLYNTASARCIPLVRIRVDEEELTSGTVMKRFPTGVTLMHAAPSFEKAQQIWSEYCRVTGAA